MADIFTVLSPEQKTVFRQRYLEYLLKRDGAPNWEAHTFAVREEFYRNFDENPVRRTGAAVVRQDVFDRHHLKFRPEERLDEATLWALCVAKTNRDERYGVDYIRQRGPTRSHTGRADDPKTYIAIEEFYHTRILQDVLRVIGIEMEVMPPSNITEQLLIKAMVALPAAMAEPLTFCGEIVGVALFNQLLLKGRQLFGDQPEPLARIEALFAQIMVDEVGHVHFLRSRLNAAGMSAARRLLPLVARTILSSIPEFEPLFGFDYMVDQILRADVDGAARPFPDRFSPFEASASNGTRAAAA